MEHLGELIVISIALLIVLVGVFPRASKLIKAGLDAHIETIRRQLDEAKDIHSQAQEHMSKAQEEHEKLDAHLKDITAMARREVKAYRKRIEQEETDVLARRRDVVASLIVSEKQRAFAEIRQVAASHLVAAAAHLITNEKSASHGLMVASLDQTLAIAHEAKPRKQGAKGVGI